MNPYVNELLHLLRSRAIVAVLAAAALVAVVPYNSVTAGGVPISTLGFWFQSGNAFDLELWTLDPAGEPYDGVGVGLAVVEYFGGNSSAPPRDILFASRTSDSQGRVSFLVPDLLVPNASYDVTLTTESSAGTQSETANLNQSSAVPQSFLSPILPVAAGFYSERGRLVVVWAGPGGSPPAGYRVVGCDVPNLYNPLQISANNCSGASVNFDVGSLGGYVTHLPLPPPVPQGNSTTYWSQVIEITNRTGAVVAEVSTGGCPIATCNYVMSPGPGLLAEFGSGLGFLLALIAQMVAYWAYANPRLTGTQDSVLTRPVTRRGLFLVRYGTLAFASVAAIVGELLLFDIEATTLLREPIPMTDLAAIAGGLVVAMLAIIGIVLLLAHLLRTPGAVLGLGIGAVLVTSLFWTLLVNYTLRALAPESQSLLPGAAQSSAVTALQLELLAPSQYPNLAVGLWVGPPANGRYDLYAIAGISDWVLVAAGAAWVGIPLLLAFWRAIRRD